MNNPFLAALVKTLRESDRYRLSAVIEMASLGASERNRLKDDYSQRCWPLLQQEQLANLRDVGPWLFGARPGSNVSGQYDFHCQLERSAGNAICGWIISAMPPPLLAKHLSQANLVTAPDGHDHLLRYHTTSALMALDARRELPGITDLLSPVRDWWVPLAGPRARLWQRVAGYDRPQSSKPWAITLDQACWDALTGDPLSHRLAAMLQREASLPALPASCHGTRIGLIQHHLTQAREQGLSREEDLITYVLMLARNGEQLGSSPAWAQALAATRDHGSPLADAILRPHLS